MHIYVYIYIYIYVYIYIYIFTSGKRLSFIGSALARNSLLVSPRKKTITVMSQQDQITTTDDMDDAKVQLTATGKMTATEKMYATQENNSAIWNIFLSLSL